MSVVHFICSTQPIHTVPEDVIGHFSVFQVEAHTPATSVGRKQDSALRIKISTKHNCITCTPYRFIPVSARGMVRGKGRKVVPGWNIKLLQQPFLLFSLQKINIAFIESK